LKRLLLANRSEDLSDVGKGRAGIKALLQYSTERLSREPLVSNVLLEKRNSTAEMKADANLKMRCYE
jgi:hypothetical protein